MLGVARKHKDKNRFDYLSKHFFLCHFTSACVSAELGHGQSSTLQATVMVSEVTSTAALRAERLGQESGKICWFGSVPLWFKCTPLIFIYLFVCFSPENKTCSMCSIYNVCCSNVGRVCCAHDAEYKDQCTKMHWWHRPVLMTLLPAPSP